MDAIILTAFLRTILTVIIVWNTVETGTFISKYIGLTTDKIVLLLLFLYFYFYFASPEIIEVKICTDRKTDRQTDRQTDTRQFFDTVYKGVQIFSFS